MFLADASPSAMEMHGSGFDHRPCNHNNPQLQQVGLLPRPGNKRKAESAPDNNERLSKRLSLLNLGSPYLPLSPLLQMGGRIC
jgi:hypothetical protein